MVPFGRWFPFGSFGDGNARNRMESPASSSSRWQSANEALINTPGSLRSSRRARREASSERARDPSETPRVLLPVTRHTPLSAKPFHTTVIQSRQTKCRADTRPLPSPRILLCAVSCRRASGRRYSKMKRRLRAAPLREAKRRPATPLRRLSCPVAGWRSPGTPVK